jgi:fermentation-respiration switch protein FrsA (DUF1100 family)
MIIAVEDDATTPTDHAEALYAVATGPRVLLMQRNTTHYAAYETYRRIVTPRIVDWFRRHVTTADIDVVTNEGSGDRIEYIGGNSAH